MGEPQVRRWLAANSYEIVAEHILEENNKRYEIIVAEPRKADSQLSYTPEELFFGPFLLKEKSPIFLAKWQQEAEQLRRVLQQLQQAATPQVAKVAELTSELQRIESILAQ